MATLEQKLEASVEQMRRHRMTTVALAKTQPAEVVTYNASPLAFTQEQEQLIRDTFANGANQQEFAILMEVAKARRLNPLMRQIHFVKRKDRRLGRDVWSAQVSIDGLRAIAERTGKYDGQDEPEYERNAEGLIVACRVRVYRKDWSRPAIGLAHWDEYVQTYDGKPTKFWADMPHVMLAKCAEAVAMRKAFPEDMSGLYVAEEMQQAENDRPASLNGANGPHSPHALPDEDRDAPPKESSELNEVLGVMQRLDRDLHADGVTYDYVMQARSIIGAKGRGPGTLGPRISALYRGDALAPSQRRELSRLWHRLDRRCARLEKELAPSVEASFLDGDDAPSEMGEPGSHG